MKQLEDCRRFADEVIFYQRARNQIAKSMPGRKVQRELERAVRDLADDNVESEGVVDIFKTAGIAKAGAGINAELPARPASRVLRSSDRYDESLQTRCKLKAR